MDASSGASSVVQVLGKCFVRCCSFSLDAFLCVFVFGCVSFLVVIVGVLTCADVFNIVFELCYALHIFCMMLCLWLGVFFLCCFICVLVVQCCYVMC